MITSRDFRISMRVKRYHNSKARHAFVVGSINQTTPEMPPASAVVAAATHVLKTILEDVLTKEAEIEQLSITFGKAHSRHC